MKLTKDLYQTSLSLLTDLYQLTMAYGYWKAGRSENESVFHLFFRSHPFKGGFTIACGLEYVIDYLDNFKFSEDDIAYLATLKGNDDKPMFEQGFLDYLADLKFTCDVEAVPEGTVVFPQEPLIRIKGPIAQCQLLETPLLNIVNYQTLVATKAARMNLATKGEPVLEFGLRRAQGIDGGLAASRAAYIGGCGATSNVLAGRLFGIPVKGTHAHSWVMSFDTEMDAFETYADVLPNNCVFLVDTYDTVQGVRHAVEVGKKLRAQGHEMIGVRLDSGDLAYLSIKAREILDEAGFPEATIVASNDLDENIINSLKLQDAKINVWGIGTKLVTAYDQPALGGVYKIAAMRKDDGSWDYKVKLSEQVIKISNPGVLQVRRFYQDGEYIGDMIFNEVEKIPEVATIIDPMDATRQRDMPANAEFKDLLQPLFKSGELTYRIPTIDEVKAHAANELKNFHAGVKRFINPHSYPVGLEKTLSDYKYDLIRDLRKRKQS
ncbi:nicotinate phosphoribosyltransferase [Microscilla marina]|uniref:Nicotinate phosphoribosyltransferase n=1 Tax=Microscilla marina ATCC 23134 TaxID=313606 RepID=A1ZDK0_MICM2|nr:nicotinate phosphoribosyltransferase [Microscilla marina]EAY31739.1 putative nicotinate phosphoribosyltransferase [Microscilla marina ATCC 23134]